MIESTLKSPRYLINVQMSIFSFLFIIAAWRIICNLDVTQNKFYVPKNNHITAT